MLCFVCIVAAMSGSLPVKAIVKTPRPGSGPAERMMGPVLAISNNSAMAPERVVRQRVIPGWSAPEPTKLDRAKIAALKAEAKAAAGFSAKSPIFSGNIAAAQINKEVIGTLYPSVRSSTQSCASRARRISAEFRSSTGTGGIVRMFACNPTPSSD